VNRDGVGTAASPQSCLAPPRNRAEHPSMRKILSVAVLLALAMGVAPAAEFALPKDNPVVKFGLPDDWNPEGSDIGVEALSPDSKLYLAVAFVEEGSVGAFLEGALAFLERNGVSVDNESATQGEAKLNGMEVVEVAWKGEDAGGPCEVSLNLVGVTEKEGLMLLYWAPPGADDEYAAEMAAIAASISPVKE
jgi:hypothetical protein